MWLTSILSEGFYLNWGIPRLRSEWHLIFLPSWAKSKEPLVRANKRTLCPSDIGIPITMSVANFMGFLIGVPAKIWNFLWGKWAMGFRRHCFRVVSNQKKNASGPGRKWLCTAAGFGIYVAVACISGQNASGPGRKCTKAACYNKGENYELCEWNKYLRPTRSLISPTYYHCILCSSSVFCKFFWKIF